MWYFVKKIEGEQITLRHSNIDTVKSAVEVANMKDTIIGYNKLTGKFAVKTLTDVLNYYISKYKLSGKEPNFYLEGDDLVCELDYIHDEERENVFKITDENIDADLITCGAIDYSNVAEEILCMYNTEDDIKIEYYLGRTEKIKGIPSIKELEMGLPTIMGIDVVTKDLTKYRNISRLFCISQLMKEKIYADTLSNVLGCGCNGMVRDGFSLFSMYNFGITQIDLTDVKLNPEVQIDRIQANIPLTIKLPDVTVEQRYECGMDVEATKDFFDTTEVYADNLYTERVNKVSEILEGRYDNVRNLFVGGLCFDVPYQAIVEKFNHNSMCVTSVDCFDKNNSIEFSEVFLDSIYDLAITHKYMLEYLSSTFLHDRSREKGTAYSDYTYAFRPRDAIYILNEKTYWLEGCYSTVEVFRKIKLCNCSKVTFPENYDSEKQSTVMLMIMFLFRYLSDFGKINSFILNSDSKMDIGV